MCLQHKETQNLQVIFFADLPYGKEIAQRLAHLFVVNIKETIVHPIFGEFYAIGCLTLCDLIFMMREDQIFATGMDIDLIAQIMLCHNRALDMPARTSVAPWRLPVWLTILFWFPEHKVKVIFLFVSDYLDASVSGFQIVQIFMRKFAIVSKLACAVIYGSIGYHIGIAFFDQGRDHLDHTPDLLGCQRMGRCRHDIHVCHVLFALCDIAL